MTEPTGTARPAPQNRMRVMQLDCAGSALRPDDRLIRDPCGHDILIEVHACGVCRTDLHVVDGDLHGPLPIVPGHEIVGSVIALGETVEGIGVGDRVGIPWLGGTCGVCRYCRSGRENLVRQPGIHRIHAGWRLC